VAVVKVDLVVWKRIHHNNSSLVEEVDFQAPLEVDFLVVVLNLHSDKDEVNLFLKKKITILI
jgi:hypothetical protein